MSYKAFEEVERKRDEDRHKSFNKKKQRHHVPKTLNTNFEFVYRQVIPELERMKKRKTKLECFGKPADRVIGLAPVDGQFPIPKIRDVDGQFAIPKIRKDNGFKSREMTKKSKKKGRKTCKKPLYVFRGKKNKQLETSSMFNEKEILLSFSSSLSKRVKSIANRMSPNWKNTTKDEKFIETKLKSRRKSRKYDKRHILTFILQFWLKTAALSFFGAANQTYSTETFLKKRYVFLASNGNNEKANAKAVAKKAKSLPLDTNVSVYQLGRSDTTILAQQKPLETEDVALSKLESEANQDYPSAEAFEGPYASTSRITDVDGTPFDTHVQVYHSGRSDAPTTTITTTTTTIEAQPIEGEDLTEKAPTLSSRITGFFKKGAAHQDYPSTEIYEGPIASTDKINDINGLPLETHVSVYHPGRSDIPPATTLAHTETQQKPLETEDLATKIGSKITGLFKKDHQNDYPTSEVYEGPIASTSRITDVDGTPLDTHVSVYHSGQYDTLPTTSHIETAPVEKDDFAAKLGSKITGFFKKGAAHQDYPSTEAFEGPYESTCRITDVDGTLLDTHVQVYHSGRSDAPTTTITTTTTTIEAQPIEASNGTDNEKANAKAVAKKATSLLRDTNVSVYQLGRSDTTILAQQKPLETEDVALNNGLKLKLNGFPARIISENELRNLILANAKFYLSWKEIPFEQLPKTFENVMVIIPLKGGARTLTCRYPEGVTKHLTNIIKPSTDAPSSSSSNSTKPSESNVTSTPGPSFCAPQHSPREMEIKPLTQHQPQKIIEPKCETTSREEVAVATKCADSRQQPHTVLPKQCEVSTTFGNYSAPAYTSSKSWPDMDTSSTTFRVPNERIYSGHEGCMESEPHYKDYESYVSWKRPFQGYESNADSLIHGYGEYLNSQSNSGHKSNNNIESPPHSDVQPFSDYEEKRFEELKEINAFDSSPPRSFDSSPPRSFDEKPKSTPWQNVWGSLKNVFTSVAKTADYVTAKAADVYMPPKDRHPRQYHKREYNHALEKQRRITRNAYETAHLPEHDGKKIADGHLTSTSAFYPSTTQPQKAPPTSQPPTDNGQKSEDSAMQKQDDFTTNNGIKTAAGKAAGNTKPPAQKSSAEPTAVSESSSTPAPQSTGGSGTTAKPKAVAKKPDAASESHSTPAPQTISNASTNENNTRSRRQAKEATTTAAAKNKNKAAAPTAPRSPRTRAEKKAAQAAQAALPSTKGATETSKENKPAEAKKVPKPVEPVFDYLDEDDRGILSSLLKATGQNNVQSIEEWWTEKGVSFAPKLGEGYTCDTYQVNNVAVKMMVLNLGKPGFHYNDHEKMDYGSYIKEIGMSKAIASMAEKGAKNFSTNFITAKNATVLQGKLPVQFCDAFREYKEKYADDKERYSQNTDPKEYAHDPQQFYLALEFPLAGTELQNFPLENDDKVLSTFLQIALSFAVFESSMNGEHRDAHNSNIMVEETNEEYVHFKLNAEKFRVPSYGIKANIIDFGNSKMESEGTTYSKNLDSCVGQKGNGRHLKCYNKMYNNLRNIHGNAMPSDELWSKTDLQNNVIWLDYLRLELTNNQKIRKDLYQALKEKKSAMDFIKGAAANSMLKKQLEKL